MTKLYDKQSKIKNMTEMYKLENIVIEKKNMFFYAILPTNIKTICHL